MNTRAPNTRGSLYADSVLAWMFFFVVLISVPSVIYVTNQLDFNYDLSAVTPFLAAGLLSFPLLVLLAYALPERYRTSIYVLLFYIGLFVFLKDVLAPLEWEQSHRDQQPDEPLRLTLVELAITLVLALAWWKVPVGPLRTFGVPLVLAVAVVQLASFILNLSAPEPAPPTDENETAAAIGTTAGDKPNIYHVVFDGYSALSFEESARELDLPHKLPGFIEFRNNLANYPYTRASVPSYLTGAFFEQGSFGPWQEAARTEGIRRALDDAGYRIWMYVPNETRPWMYSSADHVRTSYEIAQSAAGSVLKLALMTSVRVAPNALRTELFWRWNGLIHLLVKQLGYLMVDPLGLETYTYYKHLSVPLFRQFIEDEKTRTGKGNYVYMHLVLPHTPFVWDQQCNYSSEDRENGFDKQTLCANRLMAETAETLRSLDRYDDSLIIFHSDHGHEADARPSGLAPQVPESVRDAVSSALKLEREDIDNISKRLQALLLVKPPGGSNAPLATSPAPAQLADIPATIAELAAIDYSPEAGRSVLTLTPDQAREIPLYYGKLHTDFVHLVYVVGGDGGVDWKIVGKLYKSEPE